MRVYDWLCEQYAPVRVAEVAKAFELTPANAEGRLRTLEGNRRAVRVGRGLWVAVDDPKVFEEVKFG